MSIDLHHLVSGLLFALVFLVTFALLRNDHQFGTRRIARLGVLLALALVAGLVESLIPGFILPGFRLGLANIVLLFVLVTFGFYDGLVLAVLKAVLVSVLRGSFLSMGGLMALSGTLLSFLGMAYLHYLWKKCSLIGISIFGALLHVIGQIVVAYFFMGPAIWGYLPWLMLASFATGAFVGVIVTILIRRTSFLHLLGK